MSVIQHNISKHILWAKIDRPASQNAIDFEVMDELEQLVSELEKNEGIRVFILSGAGSDSFISGGDLKKFHSIKSESTAAEMSRRMQQILSRIEQLPCWTIACINGDAYGGGIEVMLAFDFRVSVPDAKFGFTQGRFYLVPGWGGLTRLTEKAGRAKTLEWLGKSEIISAKNALDENLIEDILPGNFLAEEMQAWAENLTKNDRNFIRTLKQGALRFSKNRDEALAAEIEPFAKLWVHEKHQKRVDYFLSRK